MIKLETSILLPEYQTNTYLMWETESKEALLIDPAAPSAPLLDFIHKHELKMIYVLNTHGHLDHIGGNDYFATALGVGVAIHSADAPMLTDNSKNFSAMFGRPLALSSATKMLEDQDKLMLGLTPVQIIHTPGHTKGSICLLAESYLISGDTLFEQSIGRTDLPGGSNAEIRKSIKEKLFTLPDHVLVFPGHGPATSIGLEKQNNPFVR